jgi:hypothetical protein
MLQFNHSAPVNSNAVYPNVTASAGTTNVLLDFTQSYDLSTTANVVANMINTTGPLNPWLVFQITGSSAPTASGQYNVDIWEYVQATTLLTWSTQNTLWVNTANTWGGGGAFVKTTLLSTERAFVSGSNEYNITQYLLPVDGGKYTTYNHP